MKDKTELEFRRGYYLAVANLVRMYGNDTSARELLFNFGGAINFKGIDASDVEILLPLAEEIAARNKRYAKTAPSPLPVPRPSPISQSP